MISWFLAKTSYMYIQYIIGTIGTLIMGYFLKEIY